MLRGLAIGIGLYALLGFLILPQVALYITNLQLTRYATQPANLQDIDFNPFTLELELQELRIGEEDAVQLGFDQLYLNLAVDSLWTKELHLTALRLERPQVELSYDQQGLLNLATLFKRPMETSEEAQRSLFPLRIDSLALVDGQLLYRDLRPSRPVELAYDALNLQLNNFGTGDEDNAGLNLSARGPHGFNLDWQGTLGLVPLRSSGKLVLEDIQLERLWPYIGDRLPLLLRQGRGSLSTDYRLTAQGNNRLHLDQLAVHLDQLSLNSADQRPLLNLASLDISDSSLDLDARQLIIGRWHGDHVQTWLTKDADGQLTLKARFVNPAAPEASQTLGSAAEQPEAEAAWLVRLKQGELLNSSVHLLDTPFTTPQPLLKMASLKLGEVSLDFASRKLLIEQWRSQQSETWLTREADDGVDLRTFFRKPAHLPEPPPDKRWNYRLRQVHLQDTRVHLLEQADGPLRIPRQRPLLNLPSADLSEVSMDGRSRDLLVGQLHGQQLEIWVKQRKNGRLDWAGFFASPAGTLPSEPANRWRYQIKQIRLQNAHVHLREHTDSLIVVAHEKPLLNLPHLNLDGLLLDLRKADVLIDRLHSQQTEAWVMHNKDGSVDWALFFAKPTDRPVNTRPLRLLIRETLLQEARLHFTDRIPTREASFELTPFDLQAQNFDTRPQTPFSLKANTGLGKDGRIEVEGQIQLKPFTAALQVGTTQLEIMPTEAYVQELIPVELLDGTLDSALNIDLRNTSPLQLKVSGHATLNQLHVTEQERHRELLRSQSMRVDGLNYDHGRLISINSLIFDQPWFRFIINPDGSTNYSNTILFKKNATKPVKTAKSEPDRPRRPIIEGLQHIKRDGPEVPIMRLGDLRILNGSLELLDRRLSPPFALSIEQLNGRIRNIDNSEKHMAQLDIRGKLNRFSPLNITGSLIPVDPLQFMEGRLDLKEGNLTTLSPYFADYAGYPISKGQFELQLHYLIKNGQLTAKNRIVVDNLELGKKVGNPKVPDLQVERAVAVLTDKNGRIDFNLPISGDLYSPKFDFAPTVTQALTNRLRAAATAPLKALGKLVAAGATQAQVSFPAGSSQLDSVAEAGLGKLATSLRQNPNLHLEIQGTSVQTIDGPRVAEARLQEAFQETWYSMKKRAGDKVPDSPMAISVPAKEEDVLLEGIYRAYLQRQPPAAWASLSSTERGRKMRAALLAFWSNDEALLHKLATERAAAIKAYLIDKAGIPSQRVMLIEVRALQQTSGNSVPTLLVMGTL